MSKEGKTKEVTKREEGASRKAFSQLDVIRDVYLEARVSE